MKRISIFLIGLAVSAVALSACTGDPGGEPDTETTTPSATRGPGAPQGEAVTIEPLESIDGAEEWETDGVVISVPDGMVTTREDVENGVRLLIYDEADDGEVVSVTVSPKSQQVSDADVDDQTALTQGTFVVNGASAEAGPASWEGWGYANAIRATIDSDGLSVDALEVDMRDDEGSMLVVALARTGSGDDIEQTWQYDVLRTLRDASS